MKTTLSLLLAFTGGTLYALVPPDEIPSESNIFPPIGGSFGQVARITVAADPPGGSRCAATAQFRRSATERPEPVHLDLAPGETGFADFHFDKVVTRLGQRTEVRPEVDVTSGKCSASVEVFESSTGRTTAYLKLFAGFAIPPDNLPGGVIPPDVLPGGVDPPEPDILSAGIVPGQILRLGVARGFDPQPDPPVCDVLLAFADAHGSPIGPAKRVTLPPGGMDFLDLDARLLQTPRGIDSDKRATVQPRVIPVTRTGDAGGCHASAQIYESATGWTVLAISGR